MIEEYGFDQAKEEWETVKIANKAILQKLNDEEKKQWKKVVSKIDRMFTKKQKQNEEHPTDYLPYDLAIGGILSVVIVFILWRTKKNKSH